MNLRNILLCSK